MSLFNRYDKLKEKDKIILLWSINQTLLVRVFCVCFCFILQPYPLKLPYRNRLEKTEKTLQELTLTFFFRSVGKLHKTKIKIKPYKCMPICINKKEEYFINASLMRLNWISLKLICTTKYNFSAPFCTFSSAFAGRAKEWTEQQQTQKSDHHFL